MQKKFRFPRVELATLVAAVTLPCGGRALAYESMYKPTPVGAVELKTLPPLRAISSRIANPAGSMDPAFRNLFGYIQSNDIPMTVPVEADRGEQAAMRFFVGTALTNRTLASGEVVSLQELPQRTVVSLGMRGAYTHAHYHEGVKRLKEWLATHPEWVLDGDGWAVYWSTPFVPNFMKRSEVHLPVRREESTAKPKD